MTTTLRLAALTFTLAGISAAQQDPTCMKDPARLQSKEWIAKVGLAKKPYNIAFDRRTQVVDGYKKLRLGLSRKQVEELLGSPDFEQRMSTSTGPRSDNPGARVTCGVTWAYYFAKVDHNPYDMNDEALFVYFSDKDALVWVKPLNIGLKEIGRPQ